MRTCASLKVSTCKTNMVARYDWCLKRCAKISLTQYSLYVMESRASSSCTVIFIGLLHLKKRSNEKKTPWERLLKGYRFESLRTLRYRSWRSSIPLRNVLRERKIEIFRARSIAFPLMKFPKNCWTIKYICALPSAC